MHECQRASWADLRLAQPSAKNRLRPSVASQFPCCDRQARIFRRSLLTSAVDRLLDANRPASWRNFKVRTTAVRRSTCRRFNEFINNTIEMRNSRPPQHDLKATDRLSDRAGEPVSGDDPMDGNRHRLRGADSGMWPDDLIGWRYLCDGSS